MNKIKIRFITMIALICAFAIVLGCAIGLVVPKSVVHAKTYEGTEIFSAGEEGKVGASEGSGDHYTQFTFTANGGTVYFRHNLALRWYSIVEPEESEGDADGDKDDKKPLSFAGEKHYFTMEFAFPEVNFTRFALELQSVEENVSKDGTSTNRIVFFNESGTVKVAVQNASEQGDDWEPEEKVTIDVSEGVALTIDERDGEDAVEHGEFTVYINGVAVGRLTNIGGYWLEYLASGSSTPRVPLTFVVDTLAEGKTSQLLLLKELNRQTFKLDTNDLVTDDAAPVLVINEEVYPYTLGRKWSLTYEAIDVCDPSVTVSRYYSMAKADSDGKYTVPASTDYSSLTTSTVFVPVAETETEEQYVSIRFLLTDDAGQKGLSDGYTYLAWYANPEIVEQLGEDEFYYIPVNRNEVGPYYIGVDVVNGEGETEYDDNGHAINVVSGERDTEDIDGDGNTDELLAWAEYQNAVYEAAEKASAGVDSYFYLPSLRGLIASDYCDYRNLTFSVYYYKQSQAVGSSATSASSLGYNKLKFEVREVGQYLFCVIATDSASNSMMYYVDGELVSLSSTNVWEIDEIPKFKFSVTYTGATVEEAGAQSLGYRDSSYSVKSFKIVALSGYETNYKLFYLDEAKMAAASVKAPYSSYEDLTKNINDYYAVLKDYLVEINQYNDEISENDDAWDRTDNAYYWKPASLTFKPVKVGYYFVELTLTESSLPGNVVTAYQAIDVRNPIDSPPDSTAWLEKNVVSVVLFSISAVLAIVIVILLVVKPSEKNLDEIDLEKLKKAESKKVGVTKSHDKKKEE